MTQLVSIAQLQEISLFSSLNAPLLDQFARHSQLMPYPTGQVIFREGDILPVSLHILVSGRLSIAKTALSGKETILRILPQGEIFAAPALFGDGRAPATVTALESATVLTLEKQALLDGFSQYPELALHLLGVLNQRLQQFHSRIHGLVSERALVRLVNYLESMAEYSGTDQTSEGERLREPLTYYQLARSIGITYEECVRLFKQLKPAITYRRGGLITFVDRNQLIHFKEG